MSDDEKGTFKSFRDLLKSKGGEPPPPVAATEERGWTLDSDDAPVDLTADLPEAARTRIQSRPAAFGAMGHGPPMYADVESEEMELLHSFRVRTTFPDDVLAEMRSLPPDPDPADFEGRRDLRGLNVFTIDGADAKDFDDAISIRRLDDGLLEVGVHIADVAHYVRPDTALDAEALTRGTSVYLADQVVPMLPEELSNGLCSLVPHRPRLAYSVWMHFDDAGKRQHAEVSKSVIESVRRNTYREVQAVLDGEGDPELAFLEPDLRLFERWTLTQQQLRDARGSLRIQSRERKFVFDDEFRVAGVIDDPRWFANTLIEETALAANQAVGDLFRKRGLPTIYRVHPEKDAEEIAAVARMLKEHGIRVPDKERLTGRDIGRMIRHARRKPNAEALIGRIMGLVERAVYEVKDHEDVATHWGLAREAYLHFTSPIRRYPDLIVHRWLWAIEGGDQEAETALRSGDLIGDLKDTAMHCSLQSQVAEMAEQAIGDLKVCQYLHPHIGEKHAAKVIRVSRAGLEIELDAFGVKGFLPARKLGDRVKVEGPTLTVQTGRQHLSFSEGHPISILVQDVDFLRLQVLLELAK
ncbi:MAG: ribonuclease R family protein [Planctomycetota bacterium]